MVVMVMVMVSRPGGKDERAYLLPALLFCGPPQALDECNHDNDLQVTRTSVNDKTKLDPDPLYSHQSSEN